jgi:hypothetical protein
VPVMRKVARAGGRFCGWVRIHGVPPLQRRKERIPAVPYPMREKASKPKRRRHRTKAPRDRPDR